MITKAQLCALEVQVEYADTYYSECEKAQYSDTEELWSIIKGFAGVCCSILDGQDVPVRDHWEEDADWSSSDWQYDVANGDTRLGYTAWIEHNQEVEREDNDHS